MKKFFDSRRELVSTGPGSGAGGGGAGSGGGGSFIGRVFTIGRYQVTVEEIVAEGEHCDFVLCGLHTSYTNTQNPIHSMDLPTLVRMDGLVTRVKWEDWWTMALLQSQCDDTQSPFYCMLLKGSGLAHWFRVRLSLLRDLLCNEQKSLKIEHSNSGRGCVEIVFFKLLGGKWCNRIFCFIVKDQSPAESSALVFTEGVTNLNADSRSNYLLSASRWGQILVFTAK